MPREIPLSRNSIISVLFLLIFLGATALRFDADWFDRPIAEVVNNFTTSHPLVNVIAHAGADPTWEGLIVVSLLWSCWFSSCDPEFRARMIIGVGAAVAAAFIAHILRAVMPPTFRPIFDPALQLYGPKVLGSIDALRPFFDFSSYPSDRATMFAGLSFAIFLVRAGVGMLAIGSAIVVEFTRIYLGLHYPTDIIGSFLLAGAVVWFVQIRWALELGHWFIRWERISPSSFYLCAFPVSYELAAAFREVREIGQFMFR